MRTDWIWSKVTSFAASTAASLHGPVALTHVKTLAAAMPYWSFIMTTLDAIGLGLFGTSGGFPSGPHNDVLRKTPLLTS